MIKDFKNWLSENKQTTDKIYINGVEKAFNSKIFGMDAKTIKFPMIIATTGSGDEDGFFEDAWKIDSKEELKRWLLEGHMESKMFPSPEGEYDDENDVASQLAETSWTDDFSNGLIVDVFSSEKEMKDRENQSAEEWGDVDEYDEDDRDHRLQDGDLFPIHTMHNTW